MCVHVYVCWHTHVQVKTSWPKHDDNSQEMVVINTCIQKDRQTDGQTHSPTTAAKEMNESVTLSVLLFYSHKHLFALLRFATAMLLAAIAVKNVGNRLLYEYQQSTQINI